MKKLTLTTLAITLLGTGTFTYSMPEVQTSSSMESSDPVSSSSEPSTTHGTLDVQTSELVDAPSVVAFSYEDAIRQGVQISPTSRTASSRLQQQSEILSVVKAAYLPQIGTAIKTGRSVDDNDMSITPELSVSQRVYDFGRVDSQVQQVQAETEQVTATNQIELEDIAKRISQAYILTNRFEITLNYARSYVAAVERVSLVAQDRSSVGASSQSDFTQAQGRLASAKLTANQVETDYTQNRTRLQKLLQSPVEVSLGTHDLPNNLRLFLQQNVSYADILQYREAKAALDVAKAQIDYNRAESRPNVQLVVTANKTLEGTNPSTGAPYGSDNRVEIQVAHQLYQGGASSARIRTAQSAADAAQYRLAQITQDLDSAIATQKILIDQLEVKKQVLADRIVVLEKTRDIYQEQYKLGSRSVIDLLNIEQEIYQANVERAANDHDIWFAVADYIFITGQAKQAFGLSMSTMEN